ncbi:MAG: DUF11 domain-containing protein [Gemmataceae bacterium]|nr:DUF11 domain-containing protein [Gemmataceae bacterium]MDW8265943.1 DUF11 domain-containing protein [Gemmataceae bacterium]
MARLLGNVGALVLLGVGLSLLLCGCFGVAHNPSYFPFLVPSGDIIRTHAKPPGPAFFANFDPRACRLEVRPLEATNPVMTQHVLIATVYDDQGQPLRRRRVEWMLEGVGHIVEVDESGLFPGRGYKVDNKYAVSYTDYGEHRITRGNDDPSDDFVIRPGQTWCVITSAVEGDTKVTVYAPGIHNWEKHKVFVTKHWVDAEWQLPPPAVNRAGTEHVFTTRIFRHSDKEPLANYRVRYRLLDGPPAFFLPGRTQEMVVASDLAGNASVTLAQVEPRVGINRVSVEIIRPPDPCAPAGPVGVIIARGETTKEWQAPQVMVDKAVAPSVVLGQDVPYTITVRNVGQIETQPITVRDVIPDGMQYIRSDPPATIEGNGLVWTLAPLPGGASHTVTVVFRPTKAGPVVNCVVASTPDGQRDEKCVTTQVTVPNLTVSKTGPATAVLGLPVTYQITVTNPGNGPASHVVLTDEFDTGLEHESRANPVKLELGTLAAGESRTVTITLTPRQLGRLVNRVTATADGGLNARAEHPVDVQRATLAVEKTGPGRRYLGRPAEWNIRVTNPGEVPLSNVVVRDQLPPELTFQSATLEGAISADGREVVWNLGTLQPREQKIVQVTTRCDRMAAQALNVAVATADPGIRVQSEAAIEILGLPAFRLEVDDDTDPIAVGDRTSYRIVVTNQGSLPGNKVEIKAVVPAELRILNAAGPAAHEIRGQEVLFAPVDALPPGQQLNYTVAVEAARAGNVKFRVELRGSTLTREVIEEESTTIFNPPGGGRPPAPGPLPPTSGAPSPPSPVVPTRLVPVPAGSSPATLARPQ